jgi:EmrB/QacA subfamily drug resistance transporter
MQAPNSPETAPAHNAPFTPIQRLMLTLLCFADCMVVLDFSIVNVALPSIQKALGFTAASVQWLFTGYGLVFGGFLLLGGRLSDLYGRKKIFLAGNLIFTLASLLGGLSVSQAMLIGTRCLQGLGASLLAPAALSLLMGAFDEGPARNRAFGIWGTVAAAGYSIGVVLGGVLTAFIGWRWIMFVNVPLGIVILASANKLLQEPPRPAAKPKLDLLGSVLVTGGLMLLVYALVSAPAAGWTSRSTWSMFTLAGLCLGAFVYVESKTAEPLMPMRIFLLPGIAAANLVCTFLSAALVAMNLILTLYFQEVLHYSAFLTGLAFLPHGLAASYAGPWGGRLANRFGPRQILITGMAVVLLCMILLSLVGTRNTYWYHVMPTTVLMSFALMPAFVNLTLLATSGAKPQDHGLVSGIVNTTGQLGGALGLAVLVAVAAGRTASLSAHGGVSAAEALIAGYRAALGTGAGFVAVALAIGWVALKKRS